MGEVAVAAAVGREAVRAVSGPRCGQPRIIPIFTMLATVGAAPIVKDPSRFQDLAGPERPAWSVPRICT